MSDQTERRDRYAEALFAADCVADGLDQEDVDYLRDEGGALSVYAFKATAAMTLADAELVPVLARAEEAEAARDLYREKEQENADLRAEMERLAEVLAERNTTIAELTIERDVARDEAAQESKHCENVAAALVSLRGRVEGLADEFGARRVECQNEAEASAERGEHGGSREWAEGAAVYRHAERDVRAVLAAEPTPPGEEAQCRECPETICAQCGYCRGSVAHGDWHAEQPAADDDQHLHHKFDVRKVNDPTGKHRDCRYFVLDPKHDPFASAALFAYAQEARRDGNESLALDVQSLIGYDPAPTPPAAPQAEGARPEAFSAEQIHEAYEKHASEDDWGVPAFYESGLISALRGEYDSPPAPAPQVEGGEGE